MLKQLYIFMLLIYWTANISFGQCLCADIHFKFKAKDILIANDTTNYSIKYEIIERSNKPSRKFSYRPFFKKDLEGDSLKFSIATGGGIDKLKIVIQNRLTKEKMVIITTSLSHDVPYYIDLLEFTKGVYLFDWRKITECIRQSEGVKIIICGENRFSIMSNDENFVYIFGIRPLNLEFFLK